MKLKVITITDQPKNPGFQQLKRSLDHFKYDYAVLNTPWRGFGTKINETARYAAGIRNDYTHLLFADAHDTFFLAPEREILEKTYSRVHGWIGTEKALWPPHAEPFRNHYHSSNLSEWKYPNSGLYLMPIDLFLTIHEENPIADGNDDQYWMHQVYLSGKYDLMLDQNCRIFQSIAFRADDDFHMAADNRLRNLKQHSCPIVAHGNGKTPMGWIYNLIP